MLKIHFRYVESVRFIIYRTNLFKHKINSVIPWDKKKRIKLFRIVFRLELKYLLLSLRNLLESLPAPNASSHEMKEWKNAEFFQWLQISYYIKPIQCEEIDWKEFKSKGGRFKKKAHELGECEELIFMISDTTSIDWHQWAKSKEYYWVYYSEFDMVAGSFDKLEGLDVDAYMYYLLQEHKLMKTEDIPKNFRDKVIGWPKVNICD
jgi:hypothetical protein